MLEELKQRVCTQNKRLFSSGLVLSTWGNVSARCDTTGYIVIKPSGVSYESMVPEQMVVVDSQGNLLENGLKPSSDVETHLELYRNSPEIGAIVHTHSTFATIWAQLGQNIPPLGTSHADDFYGEIPCSRALLEDEIEIDYEKNTAKVMVEALCQTQNADISHVSFQKTPAVLVKQHGPFIWANTVESAVNKAELLEEVAKMAWHCVSWGGGSPISTTLMEKHFYRKHGKNAYYGQKET